MCLAAIYWARLEHVFYSNTKTDAADIGQFYQGGIVKGGAAPLFLMGPVFEVFFEVFSLFCWIILDYVRTQIRA